MDKEEKKSEDQTTSSQTDQVASSDEQVADKSPEGEHAERAAEFLKKSASFAGKTAASAGNRIASAVKASNKDPLITVKLLDRLVEWMRSVLPPETFDKVAAWCVRYGHTGLLVAACVSILFWLTVAVKFDSRSAVATAPAYCALLIVLQYTAHKFLNAGTSLINSSKSRLSSPAFLDCFALLTEIAGIIVFFTFLLQMNLPRFFVGFGIWVLCDALAYVALHPQMLNIEIAPDTAAGEEAIGIMSFFVKAIVKIVPIAFGVGSVLGAIAIILASISVLFGANPSGGTTALAMVVACACLPFLSYVCFAIYHLLIDVLRAILVMPARIDSLRSDTTGE